MEINDSPLAYVLPALTEEFGVEFENMGNSYRLDWWKTYLHGYKTEVERTKRGMLRVFFCVTGENQDLIAGSEVLRDYEVQPYAWGIKISVTCLEDFSDVFAALSAACEENEVSKVGKVAKVGVNFQGTVFANTKERGATIGGKFGALVCAASGMVLTEMLAEFYTDSGEIDGVELDPVTQKPISIYECQAGVHNGMYLDDLHREKALGKYLYDKAILPTVRKVVILAGGYTEMDLNILRERAFELAKRPQPIEVVALVTTREGDVIGVERVCLTKLDGKPSFAADGSDL
jgi:hypothetical protein